MKIAYIGIDVLYVVLEELLEAGCGIMEIFTCRTDNVTEFNVRVTAAAQELGIPCHLDPLTLSDLERLKEQGCEAVFCAGYYHRLPILDGLPMVNVHPACLPVGRGAWPMPVMILKGHTCGGVTIHRLRDKVDEGEILLQEAFPLAEREDLESIMEKVSASLRRMIPALVRDFDTYYTNAQPQGKGEYWDCPTQRDWTITQDMEPEQMDRILRAFYGYECILIYEGKEYELIYGRFMDKKPVRGPFFPVKGGFITAKRVLEADSNGTTDG